MTTNLVRPVARRLAPVEHRSRIRLGRKVVGSFYLFTGGAHVGIVAADPEFYRHFADGALFDFVATSWRDIFMAHPGAWGLTVAAGEVALGLMLLRGGGWAKLGWAGVIAFHLALMTFGWGFWLWSVPVLALLVAAAARDVRRPVVPRPRLR